MLLLDENLSDKIVAALQQAFPGTRHIKSANLERASDVDIWSYALEHRLTIVTNDDDFQHIAEYRGFPPKVIHLIRGNLSRQQMAALLLDNAERLHQFIESPDEGYLALY